MNVTRCITAAATILCMNYALQAQDNAEMQLAESYFDAGNYARAAAEYQSAYDEFLPAWERSILLYDIGTTSLAESKWQDTLAKYATAASLGADLPLLNARLSSNRALTLLMSAKAHSTTLKENPNASNDDYSQAMAIYREAIGAIKEAHGAACALAEAEGTKVCPPSIIAHEMLLEAKSGYASLLNDYLTYGLSIASMLDGTAALIASENTIKQHLSILKDSLSNSPLADKYLERYLYQAESWTRLWDTLTHLLDQNIDMTRYEKYGKDFNTAKKYFYDSLDSMKAKDYTSALSSLDQSHLSLENLLTLTIASEPFDAGLQRLMTSYNLALVKDPIQETPLDAVAETQEAFGSIIATSTPAIKSAYEKAQHFLALSRQSLQQFQAARARLFAEAAYFFIEAISEKVTPSPKNPTEAILESAIHKQEFALLVNRMTLQAESLKDTEDLLPDVQTAALETADGFLPAALVRQKKAFNGTGPDRCQCQPWDEVVPLFAAGYRHAQRAKEVLDQKTADTSAQASIIPLQEGAIKDWKEALEKLRAKPKGGAKKQEKQGGGTPEQEKTPPKEEQKELNSVLRFVQQMESDDRSKPLIKVPGNKEVDRPW